MLLLLPLLGLIAGALTTIAGMGGGIILALAMSLAMPPALALAMSAPALLLGNLHRAWVHRAEVDRRVAPAVAGGALLGSLAGGFVLMALPTGVLRVLLGATTVFAVARALGALRRPLRIPAFLLWPFGFGVGATAATSGGAGLLMSPLLMSSGLSGEAYVATGAAIAVVMHTGRLLAYGAGGLLSAELVPRAAVLAGAILVGNRLGDSLRRFIRPATAVRIESSTLLVCVVLALLGLR